MRVDDEAPPVECDRGDAQGGHEDGGALEQGRHGARRRIVTELEEEDKLILYSTP